MWLRQRLQAVFRGNRTTAPPAAWTILTTRHCRYIAGTIAAASDTPPEILLAPPESGFNPGRHIVICPQIFDQLPDNFIAFQMEQSASPRWFEPPLLAKLQKARAIVDYSRRNLKFLEAKGIPPHRLHYLPVSYIANFCPHLDRTAPPRHEVLFYGDANNLRRRAFLDELKRDYPILELARIFGDELYREMLAAKIIVNIHYYDGALLETTRLMECLSLGCLVISEESVDMDEYEYLRGLVDFVPQGDSHAMRARIGYWLKNPGKHAERIAYAHRQLRHNQEVFKKNFMALKE